MEVSATAKYIRVQPRKVRIVADEVRGKSAVHASALLRYHPSKAARLLRQVLLSAMANAQENHRIEPETLRIARIEIDEGPRMKRILPRARGRADRIVKKTSHIHVVVEDNYVEQPKAKGKAKPRPTFAEPTKGKGTKKKAEVKEEPKAEEPTVEPEAAEAQPVEEVTETVENVVEESAPETPAEVAEEAAAEEVATAVEEAGTEESESVAEAAEGESIAEAVEEAEAKPEEEKSSEEEENK
ncbi:MAG: 50S ribosomal protein L22 [Fimbriimonadaceae bacterium]